MSIFKIAFGIVLGVVLVAAFTRGPLPAEFVVKAGDAWRFEAAWDVTDDFRGGHRSGMRLFVDHGTGCQYLGTMLGSLTPRMGADGRQVCR